MCKLTLRTFYALALVVSFCSPRLFAQKPDAAHGKKLFVADGCYQCHGLQGQGGAAAPVGAYGSRLAPPRIPVAALRAYVRHPAGMMPPYTPAVLSDAEIDDIYAFLQTIPAPKPVKDIAILNH